MLQQPLLIKTQTVYSEGSYNQIEYTTLIDQ